MERIKLDKEEYKEHLQKIFSQLKEKIQIFREGSPDEIRGFVYESFKKIDEFQERQLCMEDIPLRDLFHKGISVLKGILENLKKSDFLCSFGFCLDESNYQTSPLTKYVLKGLLTMKGCSAVNPSGVNFRENIKRFVLGAANGMKSIFNWHSKHIDKQINEIRENYKWTYLVGSDMDSLMYDLEKC